MKKSLLLVGVVAVLIWFLVPFLAPSLGSNRWPVLSVVFYLAGGFLLWALLHVSTRSAVQRPALLIQALAGAVGAIALPVVMSLVAPPPQCNADQTVTVTCNGNNPPSVDKPSVCVGPAFSVTWKIPVGARVQINKFQRRAYGTGNGYGPWILADPVNKTSYDSATGEPMKATVKGGTENRNYKYAVTCTENGATGTLDPIIEVPPKRLIHWFGY